LSHLVGLAFIYKSSSFALFLLQSSKSMYMLLLLVLVGLKDA